jgi:hypothetical protein
MAELIDEEKMITNLKRLLFEADYALTDECNNHERADERRRLLNEIEETFYNVKGVSMEQTDYLQYRGTCKELVDQAIAADPTMKAVRGYYHCPIWGKQQHWWCVRMDGTIYDPSVKQFPTAGVCAEYEEFDGWCNCAECGKRIREEEAQMCGPYPVCSMKCALDLVGVKR